jgi:hypothetical protein
MVLGGTQNYFVIVSFQALRGGVGRTISKENTTDMEASNASVGITVFVFANDICL